MKPFWIIVCIIFVPLLYLSAPYIAMFLTMIPIQIIGFIGKIFGFFKGEPTPQNSTLPEKKELSSEQLHKQTSSPLKSQAPKQHVRTYPPAKPSPTPQPPNGAIDYLQKSRDIRCDSMGNIKTYSPVKKNNSENNSSVIATIIVACVAFLAILFGIILSVIREQNSSSTAVHAHEYVNGKCVSCSAYDDAYYRPTYQSILDIMDSLNEPIKDLNTIKAKLQGLPEDYLQTKKITSQCYTLHSLCTTIRNESVSNNPDHKKIQTSLFDICEKRSNSSYSSWNMNAIINSFFDPLLYANDSITWGLLYGYWECSSGYYLSYDGEYVSTNLPNPMSHLTGYYLPVRGREIYVSESSYELGSNAFRIMSINKNWILFYCYSDNSSYTLTLKDQTSNSSSSSSSSTSTRYIGNTETKKFHYSWCSYLPSSYNRTTLYSRTSAISQGYSPCEHCNP